jgi:very-short-patch-repair endonuclease
MRDPELLRRAREMRANPTPAEARLWYHLRARRFEHLKFRHQTVLDRYIVDFTSRTVMLAIEVDGETHALQQDYDARRTRFLEGEGFRVLRFTNADVMTNMKACCKRLARLSNSPLSACGERASERSEARERGLAQTRGLLGKAPSPDPANARPPSPRKRREGSVRSRAFRSCPLCHIVTNLVRSPPRHGTHQPSRRQGAPE